MHSAFRFNRPFRAGLPFVHWGAWASGMEGMAVVDACKLCLAMAHANRAEDVHQEDLRQVCGYLAQLTLPDRFLIRSLLYYQNPYRMDPLSFAQMQHPRAAQHSHQSAMRCRRKAEVWVFTLRVFFMACGPVS